MPRNTVTVTPIDQVPPLVAANTRTISGRVLPWGESGRTNYGALTFPKGAINVPTDITNVKLLAGHSPAGVPIGHATSWDSRADGLWMTFQLGTTDAADDALMQAAEKTIDAFSIEAYGIERMGTTVTKSILSAVALVPLPAFANARVDAVHAAAHEDDDDQGDDPETEPTDPPTTPTTDTPPTDSTPDKNADTDTDEDTEMPKNLTPGTMPGTPASTTEPVHASLDAVTHYITAARSGQDTGDLLAELTDITDAGTLNRSAPAWLGELWSGVTYERRVVPLLTNSPLTSRKAKGYRWKKKPGVASYAGNKANIPSFAAEIEPVERDSVRWAGGNDLDRAFWDFNETEFLAAYWRAMAESYAFETDQEAARFLVKEAAEVDASGLDVVRAIARGAIHIDQTLHAPATFALINPADFEGILGISALDAPTYLGLTGAISDPSKWVASEFVQRGTAVMGNKAAVTHYELSGSPLRVEAEHIAKGGRDAALFGYTALMVNKPEGLIAVRFAETPAAPVVTP